MTGAATANSHRGDREKSWDADVADERRWKMLKRLSKLPKPLCHPKREFCTRSRRGPVVLRACSVRRAFRRTAWCVEKRNAPYIGYQGLIHSPCLCVSVVGFSAVNSVDWSLL
jgi:hypothetical protein